MRSNGATDGHARPSRVGIVRLARSGLHLVLAVAVATACVQRTSPTPPRPSPTDGASSASVAPSIEPSSTPGQGGRLDLAAAVAALRETDSYRFSTRVREGRTEDRYQATEVSGPPFAASGRHDTTTGVFHLILIGERAWVSRSGGPFQPSPPADVAAIHEQFDVATVVTPYADAALLATLAFSGAEPRNGTVAGRYVADAAALGRVRDVAAGASLEVWLDADGRFIALEAVGVEGADRTVQVDVEGIDDPANRVAAPG
jgi:hypothetical protein